MTLVELITQGPLPLAQLTRRALNAKSTVERHHCTFYLAEAALKLAAVTRIAIWRDGAPTESAAARELEALAHPSLGNWVAILRAVDAELGARESRESLPLADGLGKLMRPLTRSEPVKALADALVEDGIASTDHARSCTKNGALGFFELIVAYRNKVIGHGAQRTPDFYDRYADKLSAAIEAVFEQSVLFGDLKMATWSGGGTAKPWKELTGLAGLPAAAFSQVRVAETSPRDSVFMLSPGGAVLSLHPLIVYREDEKLQREHIGFLNGSDVRRKNGQEEVKRVEFLDYMTGEAVTTFDVRAELGRFLRELSGLKAPSVAPVTSLTPVPTGPVKIEVGATFAGFELLRELGRGGMGVVYEASQVRIGRVVAIKVLPPDTAADEASRARFDVEVTALARCEHPNVVKVLTAGEEANRPWFAMELVEGADLARVGAELKKQRAAGTALTAGSLVAATGETVTSDRGDFFRTLARLFAGAAEGLAELHAANVIHRDVKPANLVLTRNAQRLVVMDLGLAKLMDSANNLTASNVNVLGTLRYIAPELFDRGAKRVDARVDVYGLGATLYELATGRALIDGESEAQILSAILHGEHIRADSVDPHVPSALARVIERATRRSADARYSTIRELAADLTAVANGRDVAAESAKPIESSVSSAAAEVRVPPAKPTSRVGLIVGGAAAVAIAVGAGAFMMTRKSETHPIVQGPPHDAAIAVTVTPDAAPPPVDDTSARAKKAYDEGMAAFNVGRIDDATAKLEQAYQLVPNADYLVALAKAYDQKADFDKAIFLYERYLETAGPGPMRDLATMKLGELQKKRTAAQAAKKPRGTGKTTTAVTNTGSATPPVEQPKDLTKTLVDDPHK